MGVAPQVGSGSVKPEAQARAARRAEAGETVHLTGATGDVRIKRAGSFEWQKVGADGATLNAADQIKVGDKGQAMLESKGGGRRVLKAGTFAQAGFIPGKQRQGSKLTRADVFPGEGKRVRSRVLPATANMTNLVGPSR